LESGIAPPISKVTWDTCLSDFSNELPTNNSEPVQNAFGNVEFDPCQAWMLNTLYWLKWVSIDLAAAVVEYQGRQEVGHRQEVHRPFERP
jgi:hypothetical protein